MNERPEQNRSLGGEPPQAEPRATGSFKVKIDERDLMTGPVEGPRRRQQPEMYGEPPASSRAYLTEEERKQERKAHRKRNRIKARKNKRIFKFMWLCMVLLTSFTIASYLIGGSNDFFAVGRNEGTTLVTIPETGVDEEVLAKILADSGAIDKPEFFALYCKVKKEDMDAFPPGEYSLETNKDYEDIIDTLQGGNQTRGEEVTVTIPEGYNALEIAQVMEENEVCTSAEFLDALNNMDFTNYNVIASMGSTEGRYYKIEGYLFPDTYNFYKGEDLESVIGKMINNFQNRVSDQVYTLAEQRGMTLDQVVILASIIQGEAANTSDMFDVSSVLHNRLDFGAENDIFVLACDSTMYYPYKNPQALPENPMPYGNYNTYEVQGLPAGAICNPGAEAILAAVRPNETQYLYFCHSDDGTAYYAESSWQHEENLVLAGLREPEW